MSNNPPTHNNIVHKPIPIRQSSVQSNNTLQPPVFNTPGSRSPSKTDISASTSPLTLQQSNVTVHPSTQHSASSSLSSTSTSAMSHGIPIQMAAPLHMYPTAPMPMYQQRPFMPPVPYMIPQQHSTLHAQPHQYAYNMHPQVSAVPLSYIPRQHSNDSVRSNMSMTSHNSLLTSSAMSLPAPNMMQQISPGAPATVLQSMSSDKSIHQNKRTASLQRTMARIQSDVPQDTAEYLLHYADTVEPITTASGDTSYVCCKCTDTFTKRFSLKRHMKKHTKSRPYACEHPHCNMTFAERSTLQRHQRVHTGIKPFQCTYKNCNRVFADRTNVRRHLLSHLTARKYNCVHSICTETFKRRTQLNQHIIDAHNSDGLDKIPTQIDSDDEYMLSDTASDNDADEIITHTQLKRSKTEDSKASENTETTESPTSSPQPAPTPK